MNINRDNYEMFFLLYVDNELSAAERQEVEAFVAIHIDLSEELSHLQETVLPQDDHSFLHKESLYKAAADEFTEEQMLLHLDGELDEKSAAVLFTAVAGNEELQSEWNILQQTKLDASEQVVFPFKQSLYRRERDNVVVMRFARLAIAAALIGAGLFFTFTLVNRSNEVVPGGSGQTAKNSAGSTKQHTPSALQSNEESKGPMMASVNSQGKQAATTVQKVEVDHADQHAERRSDVAGNALTTTQKQLATNEGTLKQPVEEKTLTANNKAIERSSPERSTEEMLAAQMNKVSKPSITDVNVTPMDNTIARTAGLSSLENENEDKILYLDEDKVTRTKAGGFLRKLKRTVERNTRIKTGNGLRIAGFEFAVK